MELRILDRRLNCPRRLICSGIKILLNIGNLGIFNNYFHASIHSVPLRQNKLQKICPKLESTFEQCLRNESQQEPVTSHQHLFEFLHGSPRSLFTISPFLQNAPFVGKEQLFSHQQYDYSLQGIGFSAIGSARSDSCGSDVKFE